MAVMIVLAGSLLLFRGLGALGVRRFGTWKEATRYALAVLFLFHNEVTSALLGERLVEKRLPGRLLDLTLQPFDFAFV